MNPIVKAFHQVEHNFFSMMSINKATYDNIIAFATGVPVSNLNPAIVNRVHDAFPSSLDDCKAFYATQEVPWALVIPEYLCDESLKNLLKCQNFDLSDEGVAMALTLEDLCPGSSNTALQIKAMEDDLETWSIPLLHGFESVPEITDVYTYRHQIASQSAPANIHHFSGFIDDTVVCSLTLSTWEKQARLDDIATMPAYQKQGHATTLIHAVLKKAAELNIQNCYLEASSSGFNVYKRMGFKPIFKNYYYESGI